LTLAYPYTSSPRVAGMILAVPLRTYAKRTRKVDMSAVAVIGALSKGILAG
jgi:hypothetical protein